MIKIKSRGHYNIQRSNNDKGVLLLDEIAAYIWEKNGELTYAGNKQCDSVSQEGNYRLYVVKNESAYTDGLHLELQTGCGCWENYILSNDLPKKRNGKARLLTTSEKITVTSNCCKHFSNT